MEVAEEYQGCSHEFARRFLQTAVVVDDEAYMAVEQSDKPVSAVVEPVRRVRRAGQDTQTQVGRGSRHTLDARSVMDSFSRLGVICGIVHPAQSAMEVMRQADIVVLDWRLKKDDPEYALRLLADLVCGERDRNSLRLVAIYTGEARLEDISRDVFSELRKAELNPTQNENKTVIVYRHGQVVFYAKSDVNLAEPLKERSIAEAELPERLVADFSAMTDGLLPSVALTSLTAVREGAHMVLDQFCAELDPAFLSHRACISNPDDAERQIVNHVAEELRGLMDNAVAAQSPAGAEAVECWVRRKCGGARGFKFNDRKLNLEQTLILANEGLEKSKLSKAAYKHLAAGFAGDGDVDLDARLAWIMSFRTVFNAPPPKLWLGSVVTGMKDGENKHMICMRPRCDCLRIDDETSFFFLPLVVPQKQEEQLVVRIDGEFKRLGIEFDSRSWILRRFKPSSAERAVIAKREEKGSPFVFIDTGNAQYTWLGELKSEYAQRIAHTFATSLSRVAVDESEWLRRIAK